MLVKELIDILEKFPEDLNVNIWNGFVADYQPMHSEYPVHTKKLYRHSLSYYSLKLKSEYYQQNKIKDSFDNPIPKDELRRIQSQAEELYSQNYNNLVEKFCYNGKNYDEWYDPDPIEIIILQPGLANKSCMDRAGTLYY